VQVKSAFTRYTDFLLSSTESVEPAAFTKYRLYTFGDNDLLLALCAVGHERQKLGVREGRRKNWLLKRGTLSHMNYQNELRLEPND
jgi:hypothetical protein